MSYTNPHGQPQGMARMFTNKIREALIAEIDAINGYKDHIANSDMREVNKVWKSIMDDEKRHYGMFLTLLRKYDPEQLKAYEENKSDDIEAPFSLQTFTPNYDKQIILNNIREDIKGEFEAVVLYEDLASLVPHQDIRNTLLTISNEEKNHSEHLTRLLLTYDPDKYDGLD